MHWPARQQHRTTNWKQSAETESGGQPEPEHLRPTFMKIKPAVLLTLAWLPGAVHAQTAAAPATTITWQTGPALHTPRDHHATFLVQARTGNFLYVGGGTNYKEFYASMERARIKADGSLDAWEAAGSYPQPIGGSSVVVAGDHAVLVGGQIGTGEGMRTLKRIADVYVARIGTDGKLGSWRTVAPLPAVRFHHPALFHNGWLYVVGGQGEKEAEAGVFAARLTADGAITEWQTLRALPRPRSHHAAFVEGGNLYVVGGLDGNPAGQQALFIDVIRAPIAADGSIGEWQLVARTPHAYATHAAFAHGGYLWQLGGVEDGNRFADNVWRAELRADGRVGQWLAVTPGLPIARGHVHNTPILNGRLYSAGGRILTASADAVPVLDAAHVGQFTK